MSEFSVIIPAYKAEDTIIKTLDSVVREFGGKDEIFVVNDCSPDRVAEFSSQYNDIRLISLESNKGPAFARNEGAKKSSGEYLVFLDADIILPKGFRNMLLHELERLNFPEVIVGILSPRPANNHFFAFYKAFHMYCYTLEFIRKNNKGVRSDPNFTTQCGIIKRDLFEFIGGFDVNFKEVSIEDDEFGYRLLKLKPIFLSEKLMVQHYFDPFQYSAKKIFAQSVSWIKLFLFKRKKFDAIGKTFIESINKICAPGILLSFFICFILPVTGILSLLTFSLIFFYSSKNLLRMAFYEKGLIFSLYTVSIHFVIGIVVCCGIIIGTGISLYQSILRKI